MKVRHLILLLLLIVAGVAAFLLLSSSGDDEPKPFNNPPSLDPLLPQDTGETSPLDSL